MLLNLKNRDQWEDLNSEIKKILNLTDEQTVRVYSGLQHALYEFAVGTGLFLPHKRSIAYMMGVSPAFESLLPYFYKESYEVQPLLVSDFERATDWVENLRKDTNFVMMCADHAVTNEQYDSSKLEELLNDKKMYSIVIHHHGLPDRVSLSRPYSIHIFSITVDLAIAVAGPRFKSSPLIAQDQVWNLEIVKQKIVNARRMNEVRKQFVIDFENQLPAGFKGLENLKNRLYDRSLIYTEKASGEALRSRLIENLKLNEADIETTNMCRWNGFKMFDTWWDSKPSEDCLRGLLVISAEVVGVKVTAKALAEALSQCQI